jgi:TrmH family RNA methyltransferase
METLSSAQNPLLKAIRRAAKAGSLTGDGCCLAESVHLLVEALRSECRIEMVLVAEPAVDTLRRLLPAGFSFRVARLPERLFNSLASTETSQGVLALVRPPEWTIEQLFKRKPLVVVLDGIQDPGNAGAIIRAAEAFGATGLIFAKGTVNPFNPKAVRASAGSIFRVPLVRGQTAAEITAACRKAGAMLYASLADGGCAVEKSDLTHPCAILIGSEGHGVSRALRAGAARIRILTARVESLNAAVAAGIILYEARRQRSGR